MDNQQGKKSRWVFVCDHEFSERYMSEFGVVSICDAGFEVEIWVLRFKNVPESKPAKPNQLVGKVFIDSISELKNLIATLRKRDVITPVSAFSSQNLATDYDVQKCFSGANNVVCFDDYSQALFQGTFWKYVRALTVTPRLWKQVLSKPRGPIERVFKVVVPRVWTRLRGNKLPKIDYIFSVGAPSCHDVRRLKTPRNLRQVPIVSQVVAAAAQDLPPHKLDEKRILIVDCAPFHTDMEKTPHLRLTQRERSIAIKHHRICILKLATFLTQLSCCTVQIAAHPNGWYPKNIYKPFEIYFGETLELMESESTRMVASFGSSMTTTASLLGIPQCVVDKESSDWLSLSCIQLAKHLKIPLWRISKPTGTWVIPSGFNAESKYRKALSDECQQFRVTRSSERASLAISTMKKHLGHPNQNATERVS